MLLLAGVPGFGQASFEIKVPYREIGRSDVLQVSYTLSNATDIGEFSPPDFPDWKVVSGPEFSQQSITINNNTQNTTSYIYNLSPTRTGELSIPGATITAGGKTIRCESVRVTVDNKANIIPSAPGQGTPFPLPPVFGDLSSPDDPFTQNPVLKPGENPEKKIRDNIFIKVSASKTSCFVGEPVLVTYELYSSIQSESKINSQPVFNGCSVIEMTDPDSPAVLQKLNGKTYRVFIIRKIQLIPLEEGTITLDSATVDNSVTFSSPDDPYQTHSYSVTVASRPLEIQVKPLPQNNKPADFTGTVGQFHIHAKVESVNFPEGENNGLKIKVEGSGNVVSITPPRVDWPKGLEAFDRSDSQHLDKTVFPLTGEKTFEIPFIAVKQGKLLIPPVSFSYFDPVSETYQTIHTDSIPLMVTPPLPKNSRFKSIVTGDITNRKYLWIIPALALLVTTVLLILWKSKKGVEKKDPDSSELPEPPEPAGAENGKIPEPVFRNKINFDQELSALSGITDNQEFFTHARTLLLYALQEKLSTTVDTETVLVAKLKMQTGDLQLLAEVENIFRESNLSLYSPIVSEEEKMILLEQLKLIIHRLKI